MARILRSSAALAGMLPLVATGALYACSSSSSSSGDPAAASGDAGRKQETSDPAAGADAEAGACTRSLDEDSISFGTKACDDCLNNACCSFLGKCFDDQDCSDLFYCQMACLTDPSSGDGGVDASDDAGDGDGGSTDPTDKCNQACLDSYPSAVNEGQSLLVCLQGAGDRSCAALCQ